MPSTRTVNVSLLTVLVTCLSFGVWAGELVQEEFAFTSSLDGTGPLNVAAIYQKGASRRPLMVVQHGYGGNRKNVVYSANRFAQKGFFCICIDTRGNGGSKGVQDDGGIEIMDIYDGIQAAGAKYGPLVDIANVSIVGYSNGGGNVHFAVVRFPYQFRSAMSFFGIPDYGMWNKSGGTYGVTKYVGGTVAQLPDKYLVRNSMLAVGNLSGTRFHLAYDEDEKICPVPMQEAFSAAVQKTNYPHLIVHVSKRSDTKRWTHGYNNGHLNAAEDAFSDDITKQKNSRPVMPLRGELVVLGFIVTPRFTCILGRGDDAAAKVKYEFKDNSAKFTFAPMTSDTKAKAVVTLPGEDSKTIRDVRVDGNKVAVIKTGDKLGVEGTISSTIEFQSVR